MGLRLLGVMNPKLVNITKHQSNTTCLGRGTSLLLSEISRFGVDYYRGVNVEYSTLISNNITIRDYIYNKCVIKFFLVQSYL